MSSYRFFLPGGPALVAILAALLLGGCGGDEEETDSGPSIVASTGIAADIVSEVAGPDAEVGQIVPDGASPHGYAPSARDQQELVEADLLVYVSPALEEDLPLESAERRFAIAEAIETGSEDPHVWLDPSLIAGALDELAAQLAAIDPAGAGGYERRAEAYAAELERLDRRLGRLSESVPAERRKLVTSHDLFGYFADRYGYEVVGAPFGLSPEAEASAGELAELIDAIERERVPAVFAQRGDDPEVLRRVAEEAGVEIVDDLAVESLSAEAASYVAMMRALGTRVAESLSR